MQKFAKYLEDRPVTKDNLLPIAKAIKSIAKKCDRLSDITLLNFLRGSEIPTNAVTRLLDSGHSVVTIPLSTDEVGSHAIDNILREFLGGRDLTKTNLVWIDEALSLRMCTVLLSHLWHFLGDDFKHLSVFLLCAENGSMIRPEFRAAVDEIVVGSGGQISVECLNVPVLHWMDNLKILGVNWGRSYTFSVKKEWFADTESHSAAYKAKEMLDHYYTGKPLIYIKPGTNEFNEYQQRRKGFIEYCRKDIPWCDKKLKGGEFCLGDEILSIPHLENHIKDPHTFWCREINELHEAYRWLRSDPKVLIQMDGSIRQDYEARLSSAIKLL